MLRRWFLLPLAIAQLTAQTVPERACVEGQVVNQRTGAAIAGAQVKLVSRDGSRTQAAAERKGHFSFSGLEAGQYHVEAERTGFTPLVWNRTVLTLAVGEQVKDFTVRLTPQAVISGALLDADGVPIANVYVSALRHTWLGGKRGLISAGGVQSNDAGEYRISGLPAGDYLLRAQPRELAIPPGEDKIKRVYVATWSPGVAYVGAAVPLHLTAGDERTGATMTLRASTVVKVRGRVIRPPAKPEMSFALLQLMSPDDAVEVDLGGMAQANGPEGAFTIPDVPPRAYRIQAQLIDITAAQHGLQNMPTASQVIQVGDTDVEGVILSPVPPQTLAGLVKWDGKPPKDAGPCMVVLQGESRMGNQPPATVKADGTFSLEVAPGRFDLNIHCEAKGSYLKAARLGDADVLEAGINGAEALPAGVLQVTMATGAGHIEGSVLDTDSHPVSGATVVAISDASKRAVLLRHDTTDQNGHFKLSDLVPGAYSLYAWDQVEDEAWRSDEFIKKKYDDRRKRVHLDAGGREALQLQLIKVE